MRTEHWINRTAAYWVGATWVYTIALGELIEKEHNPRTGEYTWNIYQITTA